MRIPLLLASLVSLPLAAQDLTDVSDVLELHFGGDVGLGKRFGDSRAPSAFQLGVVDSMVHGRLSREITVLSELVYESSGDQFGFDLERLMINYQPRAWFGLSLGRVHTPLGYWNTAYHHARWMYSTVEAPLLTRFEDQQGPLPTHTIGLLVHGSVPVRGVHLEYDAGIGNGRGPTSDPPQNFADVNEGKSVVAGLHLAAAGLRFGVSGIVDATTTPSGIDVAEQVAVGDAHYRQGAVEAIVEGALILHQMTGGRSATNWGAYAQGAWFLRDELHFYARIERFVRSAAEIYLPTPDYSAALGGVRYEMATTAAVKLESGWERISGSDAAIARGQLSWLF